MRASSVDKYILQTLSRQHAHLTPLQVYEEIRQHLPAVNPSTVYRALERLAKHGKVSVSNMGTGGDVYEVITEGMHHHIVCQKCSGVKTIHHEDIQTFFTSIESSTGYRISTNHLVLFGVCEECQLKMAENFPG